MTEKRRRRIDSDNSLGIRVSPPEEEVADPPRRVRHDYGIMSLSPSGGRSFVIGGRGDRRIDLFKRVDASRQVALDDGTHPLLTGSDVEIKPPYGFGVLNDLFQKSNILRQCIDAMVTNIAGFGIRVVPFATDIEMDEAEKKELQSWMEKANVDRSLTQENRKQIFEYEKYGLRYMEVVRNKLKEPSLLRHISVSSIRQLARQKRAIKITRSIVRGGKRVKVIEFKRFRKYIQRVGLTKIYFKEFGDTRTMDYRTGRYQSRATGRIPEKYQATELMHHKQDSEDIYGVPRWISMTAVILGSREAEECNLKYFEDNMIPPAIITISGGRLTADSFKEIRSVVEQGGMSRQNQLMLLEAIPETGAIEESGVAQIKLERLSDERPTDGLFKEYDENNQAKVRSTFRLPPVLLGQSQDVTFATANVSAFVAEMQVFQPQRMLHDDWFNNSFVNHDEGLGLKTVKIESKGPTLTNPGEVVKALTAANTMGSLTPRKAIDIINEQMQVSIPQYPEKETDDWEEWMDIPIALSLRRAGSRSTDVGETQEESKGKDEEIDDSEEGNVGNVGSRRNL